MQPRNALASNYRPDWAAALVQGLPQPRERDPERDVVDHLHQAIQACMDPSDPHRPT